MAARSPRKRASSSVPPFAGRRASEAEEAVRMLIRWAGDDPGARRPARHAVARDARLRGIFRRLPVDPVELLQRTFEETDGYDEMVVLEGHPLREPLRASSRADHRQRAYRLSAEQARRRHLQARAAGRCLCQATADPGEDDGADRQHAERCAAAQRRRRGDRGGASMHDDARRAQARRRRWSPSRMLGAFRSDPSTRREFLAHIDLDGNSLANV